MHQYLINFKIHLSSERSINSGDTLIYLKVIFYLLLVSFIPNSCYANISVYPMVMNMNGGTEDTSLQVSSKENKTQYIRVTVKRIVHPATPEEREESVTADERGLIVSPPKFILPANTHYKVRLMRLNPSEQEETWRVYFESIPAPSETQGELPDKTQVNINFIWGALVRIMPTQTDAKLGLNHNGRQLFNAGNMHLNILRVAQCTSVCSWQPINKRIYPNEALPLPPELSTHLIRVEYSYDDAPPQLINLSAGTTPLSLNQIRS